MNKHSKMETNEGSEKGKRFGMLTVSLNGLTEFLHVSPPSSVLPRCHLAVTFNLREPSSSSVISDDMTEPHQLLSFDQSPHQSAKRKEQRNKQVMKDERKEWKRALEQHKEKKTHK